MNGLSPAPSARSRLQGLKQMSVEKLAIIRQRLAETRSKTTTSNLTTSSTVTSRRGGFSILKNQYSVKNQLKYGMS